MANRIKRLKAEKARLEQQILFRKLLVRQKRKTKKIKLTPMVAHQIIAAECNFKRLPLTLRKSNVKHWCREFSYFINPTPKKEFSSIRESTSIELLASVLAHKAGRKIIELHLFRPISSILRCGKIVRPIAEWKAPNTSNPDILTWSFFRHVCVQYPAEFPACLKNAFLWDMYHYIPQLEEGSGTWKFSSLKLNLLFLFASGKGLHHLTLDFRFTKKMNFHFLKLPASIDHPTDGIIWAMLMTWGLPEKFIPLFQDGNSIENIMLCEEMVRFLSRQSELTEKLTERIFAFYSNQTFDHKWFFDKEIEPMFPDFSFKKRTLNSVLRFVERWERWLEFHKNQILDSSFVLSDKKDFEGNALCISQIKTPLDLVREADFMEHCVAEEYMMDCIEGKYSIWSVWENKSSFEQRKRLATISVCSENKLDDFKARFNAPPPDHVNKVVKTWINREGIDPGDLKF